MENRLMRIAAFSVSFLLTAVLTPFIIRHSYKRGLLDYPKEKSIHTRPMPMAGGLVIFFVFFVTSL
ncbi:MAG: undecaprenyl/decaprenyl-phosphate alpha-N-acetylglucosaminyl 1-phosphate transferase, partial [Candidatus Omnitrophica bacterium]|nr:undecaprenyl/decaprenyl-phosphate alpha-N-acetylglucosaminyl 1-phosphate transferase [Candidatus Omnitrophota bacterium]